jgi:hypothetical protein
MNYIFGVRRLGSNLQIEDAKIEQLAAKSD